MNEHERILQNEGAFTDSDYRLFIGKGALEYPLAFAYYSRSLYESDPLDGNLRPEMAPPLFAQPK